jgi:hypothetical protein
MLGSVTAHACGCSKPTTVSDPQVQANADVIFTGEVVRVSTRTTARGVDQTVTFKVTELVRGPREVTFIIEMNSGNTSCDLEALNFRVGERYLMSAFATVRASAQTEATYYNNFCCLRELLSSAVPAA